MSDPRPPAGQSVEELLQDRFVRNAVIGAVHVRRHLPLYVIGMAVLLVAALLPTVGSGGGTDRVAAAGGGEQQPGGVYGTQPGAAGTAGTVAGTTTGTAPGTAAATGTSAAGPTTTGGGPAAAGSGTGRGAATVQQPAGTVQVGTGTARGGFACKPGVPQIPWSAYAAPCVAQFTGGNGGGTSRGVSANEIVIADREFECNANCQTVQQVSAQAGTADPAVKQAVAETFISYFNKVFETYGRKVVFKPYKTSANSTDEALGNGKQQACADADAIAKDMKAFGEFGYGLDGNGNGGSGPFSECAAQYKLVEFSGGAYYDETWYRQLHPYVWNGIMGCERVAHLVAEQIYKEMQGPAKWAGDPTGVLQKQNRIFGTYIPNNPPYQRCAKTTHDDLQNKYGIDTAKRSYQYNYVLDVSRFADQANQAIIQFRSEGVTTVVIACDPISPIFLTQSAHSQNYYPEWYIVGTAANDFDTVPRLWDSTEVDGHLFGLGQLSAAQRIWGPSSEPGITYQRITGKEIPAGTDGFYFDLMRVFNFIQAAGPDLTPQSLAQGAFSLPQGGISSDPRVPKLAVGRVCYCTNPDGSKGYDHTGIDDTRIVYWDGSKTSAYDGKQGTYIEYAGGARYLPGDLPKGIVPVYSDDPTHGKASS